MQIGFEEIPDENASITPCEIHLSFSLILARTRSQVQVKEAISSSTIYSDIAPVSKESLKAARAALKKLDEADEERIRREAAQNALETFIYDTKDKLNNDEFGNCANGSELLMQFMSVRLPSRL